ncbi:MAG: hypothetical protein KME50_05225 [Nostoc desertorum CM1-VF14]|nr:hypothetical protein [Nostoc desertorum CM1-VF14]
MASEHLSLGTALYKEVSIDFQKAKSFLNETTGKAANGFTELSNKSLSNVSEVAEKVNSSLNETVGGAVTTITNKTGEAINTAAEITDKAKGSLSQTAAKTSDIVAEKTGKAIYTFTQKAEHAKDSLTQTAEKAVDNVSLVSGKAVNTIAETAKQAEDSLLETFEKSKNSVEDTIQKAEQLSATASTAIENAVNGFINHRLDALNLWIEAHPAISWTIKSVSLGVDHPIYCIVIILLTIFILWQLIKTFSRLIEQGLLVTLTAPFKFVQSLFKFSFKSLSIFTDNSTSDLGSQPNNERLAKLLTRLEAIKQEQNEILQQITNLVSSTR